MKRYASLVIIVAATIGLRAPLCAYACSESGSPADVVSAADPHAEEAAPCHGNGATTPEQPTSNRHECGCDDLELALTVADTGKGQGPLEVAAPRPSVASSPVPNVATALPRHWVRRPHSPPADILLLKSTLII